MNVDLHKMHEIPKIPTELTDPLIESDPPDNEWILHQYTNRPDLLDYYRLILRWYQVPVTISDWIWQQEFFVNHEHSDTLSIFYHKVLPNCNGIHTDDLRTFTYNFVIDSGQSLNKPVPVGSYDKGDKLRTQISTQSGTWYYLNVAENHRVWDFDNTRHLITVCDILPPEKALKMLPGLMV